MRRSHGLTVILFFCVLQSQLASSDRDFCPGDDFPVQCDCRGSTINCLLYESISSDSPFWLEFGAPSSRFHTLYIGISANLDPKSFDYFPVHLFDNLSPHLTDVILNSWRFDEIPTIPSLVKSGLKTLEIKNNENLTSISPNAFLFISDQLGKLLLSDNALKHIAPGAFSALFALRELKLSANSIVSLSPRVFTDLKQLNKLDLASNALVTLDRETFHGLTSLQELDLNRNKLLTLLNGTFEHTPNLRTLDLSHNQIDTLEPNVFKGLQAIDDIDLADNQLRTLPDHIFTPITKTLKILDLKSNQLTNLSENQLQEIPKQVYLRDNPWVCDCSLVLYGQLLRDIKDDPSCQVYPHFNSGSSMAEPIETTFKGFLKDHKSYCTEGSANNNKDKRSNLASVHEFKSSESDGSHSAWTTIPNGALSIFPCIMITIHLMQIQR